MSFTMRRVSKDVLAYYSEIMDLCAYDPYHMVDELEELLAAAKKAEKLTDEGARKAGFENVAIKSHSLYLGLIMIHTKLPTFHFPAELLAPLHGVFCDAAVTGLLDCRWPHFRYQILAYLEAFDLLIRVEVYDWSQNRDTSPDTPPDTLDVAPDALELLKSIYNQDPQTKRKMMLAEFRRQRRNQKKRGIGEALGLKILRSIELKEI